MKSATERSTLEFIYVNHRGEKLRRRAVPLGSGLEFKATAYHPEAQWILRAFDLDKQEVRDFALRDCDFLTLAREF